MPIYNIAGYTPSLDTAHFALLTLSMMLIGAAGYVINDCFDVETDQINRPHKQIIGKHISLKKAYTLYAILNITAIIIGFYVAYKAENNRLVFLHLAAATAFWFYSTTFKRKPFIGNFLVAFCTAAIVLVPIFFEQKLLETVQYNLKTTFKVFFEYITGYKVTNYENALPPEIYTLMLSVIGGYALFAFLLNLIREVIKDLEDYEGDVTTNCNTLPIATSISFAKLVASGLCMLTFYILFKFQISELYLKQYLSATAALLIQIPLIYLIYKIRKATIIPDHFTPLSKILKILMLIGLCYLPYFKSTITVAEPQNGMDIQHFSIENDSTLTPMDVNSTNPEFSIQVDTPPQFLDPTTIVSDSAIQSTPPNTSLDNPNN